MTAPSEAAPLRVGLLHTVPALADSFDRMLADAGATPTERVHVVDAQLLRTAIAEGITDAVSARVAQHLTSLAAQSDVVLVTCSSIGEAAEAAAASLEVPVVRVDAPMAEAAVRLAAAGSGRIAVLATNTATLGPTARLIERAAREAGVDATVSAEVVEGAASARAAGDSDTHDALIAAAVRAAGSASDAIVLAQASMAPAAGRAQTDAPVLTSPAGGVAAALAVGASRALHDR